MTSVSFDAALIGRADELAELTDALERARAGQGQVATLGAEAGLGKSRLAREVAAVAAKEQVAVLWGSCSESDLALPLLPFNEAFGNRLARTDLHQLRSDLGPMSRPLSALVPQLAGPDDGEIVNEPADPAAARLRLFEAVVALVGALSTDTGMLLVVDDAHWADASTCELLDFLARRVAHLPVLLVVTYRRDEVGRDHPLHLLMREWRRSARGPEIELQPFTPEHVSQKLAALFEVDRVSEGLIQLVWSRSEGNPFVLEELLHEAIARGDIYRDGDRWQRKPLAELHLPVTVAESILSRVDRLRVTYIEVLQAAAVLGRTFDVGVVAAVCGESEETTGAAVEAATRQWLVEEDPQRPGLFRFRHALTHEAIAGELTLAARRRLHSRAADVLAALPTTPPVELARHLLDAGRAVEAAPFCVQAAESAERAGAFAQAAMLYELSLPGLEDVGERGRVECRLGLAFMGSGQPMLADQHLESGIRALERAGRRAETGLPLLQLGGARWLLSRRSGVLEAYDQARAILEQGDPTPDLALLYARTAAWHLSELDCAQGLSFADQAVALAREVGSEHSQAAGTLFRGWALCELGRRDEGLVTIDEGTQEAMRLLLPEEIGTGLAISAWQRGFAMRANELTDFTTFLRSVDMGPAADIFANLVDAIGARWVGHVTDLERAADAVVGGAEAVGIELIGWFGRELLAIARLEQRRLPEAEALLDDISHREPQWQREWVPTRIWLRIAHGDIQGAADQARRLLAMGPWAARDPFVAVTVCHALVLVGAIDEAAACVEQTLAVEHHPYALAAASTVAFAAGDRERGVEYGSAAVDALQGAGYRLTEGHVRITLVEGGAPDAAGHLERAILLAQETGSENLAHRVRQAGGDVPAPPAPAAVVGDDFGLSPRERELLGLIAQGRTDAEIAGELYISVATVRSHLDRVRDKTGRRRRPDLTLLAMEMGLVGRPGA